MRFQRISLLASLVAVVTICSSVTLSQVSGPEQCAAFNSLSERHGNSAREIATKAQEQAKTMPAADAEKFLAANKVGADSEWEMAGLARDAYRKCMQDYLGGSAAAPQAPAAAAPAQQQQAVQQPVQQAQPAKQRAQQKPRVQQQQSNRVVVEPQRTYQPVFPGLINLGVGIGLGGYR